MTRRYRWDERQNKMVEILPKLKQEAVTVEQIKESMRARVLELIEESSVQLTAREREILVALATMDCRSPIKTNKLALTDSAGQE